MIQCENTGLVYTNPRPYLKAVHAWHPSIAQVGGNEFVCAFDLGEAAESLDYRTYIARSTDGGLTWQTPQRLFHDRVTRPSTHTARISALRDGTLVGFGARFYRDDAEQGLTNRATLGFVPMDLLFLESRDGGQTWKGPEVVTPPLEGPAFEICHSIVELADGRLLAPTQTWPAWDGRAPNGWQAIALVSSDRGCTWPEYITVFGSPRDTSIYFEQSITQLSDGQLLAMAWAYDPHTRETLPNPYAISSDGQSFSSSRPTGLHGQTAKLLALRDGRVLCVYRREDQPGLWAQLVRIDGDKWINLEERLLWRGESHAGPANNTSDQLCSLKFGYPSMVEVSSGLIKIVFWCAENGVHNIRWFDVRIAATVKQPHFSQRANQLTA